MGERKVRVKKICSIPMEQQQQLSGKGRLWEEALCDCQIIADNCGFRGAKLSCRNVIQFH